MSIHLTSPPLPAWLPTTLQVSEYHGSMEAAMQPVPAPEVAVKAMRVR